MELLFNKAFAPGEIWVRDNTTIIYKCRDFFVKWETGINIENICGFISECNKGMHDDLGCSGTFVTMDEAINN